MSYFNLFTLLDSPRRICDALPLSTRREGGCPLADAGESSLKYTTFNSFHNLNRKWNPLRFNIIHKQNFAVTQVQFAVCNKRVRPEWACSSLQFK